MAAFKEHALAGAVVGTIGYFLWLNGHKEQFNLAHLAAATSIGAAAGLAADIIEPALHSHHRAFFHSAAVGCACAFGLHQIWNNPDSTPAIRLLALAATLGHTSHLALDSLTPRGLPLL